MTKLLYLLNTLIILLYVELFLSVYLSIKCVPHYLTSTISPSNLFLVLLTRHLKIIGFDATNVRRFFAHKDLDQIVQAIFELSHCSLWTFLAG